MATEARPSALLDARNIHWTVIYSFELSASESTLAEFLNELYVQCVRQGVEVVVVTMAEIKRYQRGRLGLKKKFEQLAMSSRDIKHLFAAASAAAELFITRDADFLDPKNKRKSRRDAAGNAVATLVFDELAMNVLLPKEAVAHLLAR